MLPDALAQDPERLARFEREAKVLIFLNHPHIAQIYGVEERALVMELVAGPTLAERIANGPIPRPAAGRPWLSQSSTPSQRVKTLSLRGGILSAGEPYACCTT